MNPANTGKPPVVSEFANDADMIELVEWFVDELPGRMESIKKALREKDVEALSRVAHQMKGAAGGYGFAIITDAARDLEQACRDHDCIEQIEAEVGALADLCSRARARTPEA